MDATPRESQTWDRQETQGTTQQKERGRDTGRPGQKVCDCDWILKELITMCYCFLGFKPPSIFLPSVDPVEVALNFEFEATLMKQANTSTSVFKALFLQSLIL